MFLSGALLLPIGLIVLFQGIATLERLQIVEAERDRWQRPSEVLANLGLREGGVVVDLGCGAGYFALKLSRTVGSSGKVIAVDIRRLSLTFLWIRAILDGRRNLAIVKGDENGSHLPEGTVDAILIANTYHELANRGLVLAQAFRALRSGGRVVILDRGPEVAIEPEGHESSHHEVSLAVVGAELADHGFELVNRVARFIDRAPDERWWLVVARKRDSNRGTRSSRTSELSR